MNRIAKAAIIGCSVEAVLAGAFALGGFGPCGPANPIGFAGLLGHIFPSLLVVWGLGLGEFLPNVVTAALTIAIQSAFWSFIALWLLAPRPPKWPS